MPTDAKYPIGAAAIMVGKPGPPLSISTVRNWTREYARHLSADANPPLGTERRYDERDIAVLRLVRDMRESRIPTADIHARLQDATIPIMDVLTAEESTESPPEDATNAAEPLQLPAPVLNDIVGRLQGFERLESRVDKLEKQHDKLEKQHSIAWVAVAAFAAGAVVVAVVVWLVLSVMR